MKRLDDVQRASILRSEAYLRKKAMRPPVSYRGEILAGVLFLLTMIGILIIGLAL